MEKQETVHTVSDLMINTLYMMTQTFELIMRDFERRIKADGIVFRHEKKQQFNRLMKSIRDIHTQFDLVYNDIMVSAEEVGWKELDLWARDANALARMILLWADKCGSYPQNEEDVFSLLKALKGEGIVTEDVLKRFYLK